MVPRVWHVIRIEHDFARNVACTAKKYLGRKNVSHEFQRKTLQGGAVVTNGEHQGETTLPKIGAPATRALASIGVTTVEQLAGYTEQEILALHGVGPRAIRILGPVMDELGVAFRGESEQTSMGQQ